MTPALDLRLVSAAGSLWLTVALLVQHASRVSVAVAATTAVLIPAASLAVTRWPGAASRVAAVTLAAAATGAVVTALHTGVRDASPLRDLEAHGRDIVIEAVLTDDPRLFQGRWGPGSERVSVPATVRAVDGTPSRGRVRLKAPAPGWTALLPGQRVRFVGAVAGPGRDLTVAELSADGPPLRVWPPSAVQTVAGDLRSGLREGAEGLPESVAGLLPGLVVGDTSRMPDELREDFRVAGLSHLVAVSGTNCAIVTTAVFAAASAVRLGRRPSAGVAAAALVGFVVLARPSASVLRAAGMGLLALVALATTRTRPVLAALGATVILLVVLDPGLSRSPGFVLSVAATAAIVLLAPTWTRSWATWAGARMPRAPVGLLRLCAAAAAVPVAAQAACGPVIAGIGGGVSLVAVPANLLAAPAVAPATVLGVLAAVVSPLSGTATQMLCSLAAWPVRWLVWVGTTGASAPGAQLPWPEGLGGAGALAAVTVVAVVLLHEARTRRPTVVASVTVVVVLLSPAPPWLRGWPPPNWVVVMCDVGQGDATVLRVTERVAAVVDVGTDPRAVDRCLDDLGVREVPVLALSHPHRDHVGGVAGVAQGHRVGRVWVPARAPGSEMPDDVVADLTPVAVEQAPVDDMFAMGSLRLRVLGPEVSYRGTRSDPNNASLVLHADVAGVSVLLPGDIEVEAQRDYAAAGEVPRVDVLKVPHHGSRYQDPDFLAAAAPRVALVGVGADNPYGHPDSETVRMLTNGGPSAEPEEQLGSGAVVMLTRDCGDVAVQSSGAGRLSVTARRCTPGG